MSRALSISDTHTPTNIYSKLPLTSTAKPKFILRPLNDPLDSPFRSPQTLPPHSPLLHPSHKRLPKSQSQPRHCSSPSSSSPDLLTFSPSRSIHSYDNPQYTLSQPFEIVVSSRCLAKDYIDEYDQVHQEWKKAATELSLSVEAKECLLTAVCIAITDPLHGLNTRSDTSSLFSHSTSITLTHSTSVNTTTIFQTPSISQTNLAPHTPFRSQTSPLFPPSPPFHSSSTIVEPTAFSSIFATPKQAGFEPYRSSRLSRSLTNILSIRSSASLSPSQSTSNREKGRDELREVIQTPESKELKELRRGENGLRSRKLRSRLRRKDALKRSRCGKEGDMGSPWSNISRPTTPPNLTFLITPKVASPTPKTPTPSPPIESIGQTPTPKSAFTSRFSILRRFASLGSQH